jgi:hypothetical protein
MNTSTTWITHGVPLPPLINTARAQAIDAAMHADKQARTGQPLVDGYEARRQATALRNESRFFTQGD